MQTTQILKTEKRDTFGRRLASLRKEGKLPVVVYGPKQKTEALFVSSKEFKKIWQKVGETGLVELSEPRTNVLIHQVSHSPVTDEVVHVDFYAVEMDKKIKASVPIEFQGVAPAVKDLGGILLKIMHELEVEALPANLPHELVADISVLKNFEDKILAKEISLPTGVTLISDPEEVVAIAEAIKEEEETPTMTIDDIEVEAKGKKEEEVGDSEEKA